MTACCRYIELNPLRAGMVTAPVAYRWSSYTVKVKGTKDIVVDFHPSYLALGANAEELQKVYVEYVLGTVPEHETELIREALQRGQLTGSDRFLAEIEKKLGIPISNKNQDVPEKSRKINLSPFLIIIPGHRRKKIGTQSVNFALQALKSRGCIEVNLQIRATNTEVASFYKSLEFTTEYRLSMGIFIK